MEMTFQGKPLSWFYINLDSRPDRREHAEAEFAAQDIEPRRLRAFLPEEWNGNPRDVRLMKRTTPGAIGCYMSQLSIIQSCPSDEIVAVCEDDICFAPDMARRLQYAEKALPDDWDVFYLGATFHVPGVWCRTSDAASWRQHRVDAEPTADKHIMRVYGQWGTYAYLVNGFRAQKVIDALAKNCRNSRGIDHNFIQLGDKLNAYSFVPGMAWQYDNQSNIGSGVTEFSGFKTLGPYAWTDKMTDFDPATFNWQTGEYYGNS